MGESQKRWYEKQRALREQIKQFKADHPEEFQAMVDSVKQKELQRQREEELARQQAIEDAIRREKLLSMVRATETRLKSALICRALPEYPGLEKLPGRIALRQWDFNREGWLTSNGYRNDHWHSVMIADRVPSPNNSNGLYCVEISADGLLSAAGGRVTDFCGLIELRGHCEIHGAEHVIRAEWARVLTIYVLEHTKDVYLHIPQLMEHYPGVPIHVTTRELVAKYLLRIAMWQETGDRTYLYTTHQV